MYERNTVRRVGHIPTQLEATATLPQIDAGGYLELTINRHVYQTELA